MPKYVILETVVEHYDVIIDADSPDEAVKRANKLSASDLRARCSDSMESETYESEDTDIEGTVEEFFGEDMEAQFTQHD